MAPRASDRTRSEDEEESFPADEEDIALPEIDPEVEIDAEFEEDEDEDEPDEETETETEAPAPKAKKKADEEEAVAHPDTPVPTFKKMRAALDWAFEGEDDVPDGLLDAYTEHALLMLQANRVMNLTAILDPKEIAAKHYLDSWRVTRMVSLMARKALDLGSGAGFPGIPLALAEVNASMTLAEATQKKAAFLQECCEKLGMRNLRVVPERAEDYLTRERVDLVLVRAVSSVRENIRTLRKVRHSLKDMVMLKGSSWSREVRAAEREAERLGFILDAIWEHELPGEMGGRAILVYRAPGGHGL